MAAITVTRAGVPRLPRRARVAVLTVHVVTSVGWLGLLGALVALEVICLVTVDPAGRAWIDTAMAAVAVWVLTPVVFSAVVSGLVLALSTPWGLVRHWWVLAKCAIASTLTAAGVVLMLPVPHQIIVGDGQPTHMQTLIVRSVALILLLLATGISVVKPWGKTPHGRRTQLAGGRTKKRSSRLAQQK
ncbi:MAG: hypothetical protein ACRDRG_16410 [Pseudonocardiaceae bacterium]